MLMDALKIIINKPFKENIKSHKKINFFFL